MVWWTMLMDIFLVIQSWNTIAYIVYATSNYIIDVRAHFIIAWLLPFLGKSWECKECEWNTMGCQKMTGGWIKNGNSWIQLIVIRFRFYSLFLLYAIKKRRTLKKCPIKLLCIIKWMQIEQNAQFNMEKNPGHIIVAIQLILCQPRKRSVNVFEPTKFHCVQDTSRTLLSLTLHVVFVSITFLL